MTESPQSDNRRRYRQRSLKIQNLLYDKYRKSCNRHLILNRLPITKWLPNYKSEYIFQDFLAGITVGLTAIPQGIAYGVVAGLPPEYGLYSSFVGCFVYLIFGSCKDVTIGPTAIMALMVQRYVAASADYAILSGFLAGCVILLLGCLNLAPVVVGFTSAAAITIGTGQIQSILGIGGQSNEFLKAWINVFKNIHKTRGWDAFLGISLIIYLLLSKKLKDVNGRWGVLFKYLSLARNALALIFGTTLAYIFAINSMEPFLLTGEVPPGFPPVKPPPVSTIVNNQTVGFGEMLSELGSSLIAIPLVSIIESIAIAKAFSKGHPVDATQEMIALGLCNIVGSFFSSMPTTGSFTRTALNNASGVRTTAGGIFTGILVLMALSFLTGTFYYIPKTVLASVIIAAMFSMVNYEMAIEIYKVRRIDLVPMFVTVIVCLLTSLEMGIVAGMLVNVAFLLYNLGWPDVETTFENINNAHVMVVTPMQSLVFPSAEYILMNILKAAIKHNCSLVVIDGNYIHYIDFTVAKNLEMLVRDLNSQQKKIVFWRFKDQPTAVIWRLSETLAKHLQLSETVYKIVENVQFEKSSRITLR